MNMFKPIDAKTPAEYIAMIDQPRRDEVQTIFDFICNLLPTQKPYIQIGMLGWMPFHYKTKSGQEGDWSLIGLASQKNYISVYACASDGKQYVPEKYKDQLPKASIGRSCIRFKKVSDIDLAVLKKIILESVKLSPQL